MHFSTVYQCRVTLDRANNKSNHWYEAWSTFVPWIRILCCTELRATLPIGGGRWCAKKHAFAPIFTHLYICSMQNTQIQTNKHGIYIYIYGLYICFQGYIYAYMPWIYIYMAINALILSLCYIYIYSTRPNNTACMPLVLQEAAVSMA